MKQLPSFFFCGALFGTGLAISGMINPEKVVGFLDLSADWDPSLAFVMGGALLMAFPLFALTLKRDRPRCSDQFCLPTKTEIEPRLILGAALFGIGWGLAGIWWGLCLGLGLVAGALVLFVRARGPARHATAPVATHSSSSEAW